MTTYTRLYNWQNDRDAGIPIKADRMDQEFDQIIADLNAIDNKASGISTADSSALEQGWLLEAHPVTWITSPQRVQITGVDLTARYSIGRRVHVAQVGAGDLYGTIISTTYTGGNTNFEVNWDTGGTLSNTILALWFGDMAPGRSPYMNFSIGASFPQRWITGYDFSCKDIYAARPDGTGVIFFGGGSRYLYYNGTNYQFITSGIVGPSFGGSYSWLGSGVFNPDFRLNQGYGAQGGSTISSGTFNQGQVGRIWTNGQLTFGSQFKLPRGGAVWGNTSTVVSMWCPDGATAATFLSFIPYDA